jgi:hypothetical protein
MQGAESYSSALEFTLAFDAIKILQTSDLPIIAQLCRGVYKLMAQTMESDMNIQKRKCRGR